MTADFMLTAGGLLFIIALIYGLGWLLKKSGLVTGQLSKSKTNDIIILETRMIDARNRLHAVSWRDQEFLISSNPAGCQLIATGDPTKNAKEQSEAIDFQKELKDTAPDETK